MVTQSSVCRHVQVLIYHCEFFGFSLTAAIVTECCFPQTSVAQSGDKTRGSKTSSNTHTHISESVQGDRQRHTLIKDTDDLWVAAQREHFVLQGIGTRLSDTERRQKQPPDKRNGGQ